MKYSLVVLGVILTLAFAVWAQAPAPKPARADAGKAEKPAPGKKPTRGGDAKAEKPDTKSAAGRKEAASGKGGKPGEKTEAAPEAPKEHKGDVITLKSGMVQKDDAQ